MIEPPFPELKIYEIVAVVQASTYNSIPSVKTFVRITLEQMFLF